MKECDHRIKESMIAFVISSLLQFLQFIRIKIWKIFWKIKHFEKYICISDGISIFHVVADREKKTLLECTFPSDHKRGIEL